MSNAAMVIRGNAIFDGTGAKPFAGGIAVEGKRIAAVVKGEGIDRYIGPDTRVIDCGDRLVMPGFNDGHTHITQGAFLEDPDFSFCLLESGSREEAIQMAKEYGDSHPDNEWVFGYMMNNLLWKDQTLPTCHDIDRVISDRPVVLQLADMHTVAVNTCAIEKIGITKDTKSPADGVIEKDEKGELTGRFYDGASFAFTDAICSPSDEVYMQIYENLFDKMKKLGITSCSLVAPYGAHDDPLPYFEKMEEKGTLTSRVMMYPNIAEYEKESFAALQKKYADGKLRIRGLKQLIDGVTSVFTAYLLEPYTNDPGTCGATSVDMKEFKKQALEAIKDGVPLRIHTIGDRAVREMLDIFEEGERLYGKQNLRHVQEHLETIHPEDIPRFAKLGICGCMQPWHMLFDLEGGDKGNGLYGDKEAAVGSQRAKHSWPMRELLDAGMVLSLGSDFPVVGLEPMCEIYGAVTRQTFDGKPEEGWYPEQRITMEEALKAYTWGSAYAEGCEQDLGILAEGMLADIIVLDKNLFEAKPQEILDTKVVTTIMDGQVVYEA
ncbi:amidohydrolase [Schaedlerella arabinosiphila]|nr:amidohydrolase [Schaedlerella arabinosiphila]KAI4444004.1 N-substituted formamide deformylase [Schaedlerella arabinosiphila]